MLFYQRLDGECHTMPPLAGLPGSSDGGVPPSGSQQGLREEAACSMDTN